MGLVGILAIAAMRCVILFAPQVIFDSDPAVDSTPLIGLGPAGSMLLDVILLAACVLALLGEWCSGRGLRWIILLLALIPAPIVLWHGSFDAGNLWLGSAWLAAAAACAAIAHLVRDRTMRTVIISTLLAAIVPVLARGVVQVTHEHAQTVKFYEENREAFLRDRGWAPDSSAAQIYERRLRDPQPTGWFATSNVLASMAAFGLVMSIGLSIAAARTRMKSGWIGALAIIALAAATMLWLTRSKGAALATAASLLLLVLTTLIPSLARRVASRTGLIVIALVALTLAGVAVRGTLLPEDFLHEKSLLFRWHYLVSSSRIVADAPWLGVGPDGFQASYTLHRVPRNPEEVSSAHSVFVDWLCTLGISGLAWMALVLSMVGRAGSRAVGEELSRSTGSAAAIAGIMAVVLLALIPAMILEWPALDDVALRGRLFGIGGFVMAALVAAHVVDRASPALIQLALLAAAAALLVHGQIEMTFTQPGAAVWAMCVIGALGIAETSKPRNVETSKSGGGAAVALVGLTAIAAVWIFILGCLPAFQQQGLMMAAARSLEVIRAAPSDANLMAAQRRSAARMLTDAYDAWPINVQPLDAAADQLLRAASHPDSPDPISLLSQASEIAERAIGAHDKSSSINLALGIHAQLAMKTREQRHWDRAIELAREMTRRDPNGMNGWRRLGDVLWAADRRDDAAAAYRHALQRNANFELDPLKQMPESERQRIESRLEPSK